MSREVSREALGHRVRIANRAARHERRPKQARRQSTHLSVLMVLSALSCTTFFYDGFTGLALLGLAILFVALQFDVDHGTASNSYLARQVARRDARPHIRAAAAVELAEIETAWRPLYLAKVFGLGLIVVGIGSRLIQ